MAISDKLTYLNETKSQLKDMINYGLPSEQQITSSTTFRNYVSSIFNAFLEALRTPDTLFTNLPKKSGSGSVISLNDTANAPMRIELGASELTQDGTPTPSSPQAVHTISGSNKVVVNGKNLTNIPDGSATMNNQYYKDVATNIVITSGMVGKKISYSYDINITSITTTSTAVSGVIGRGPSSLGMTNQIKTATYSPTTGSHSIKIENVEILEAWVGQYLIIRFIGFGAPSTCSYEYSNVQIEYGETATTYEPYISQEAEVDLTGKNIFDGSVGGSAGEYLTNTNAVSTGASTLRYTNYIKLKEGQTSLYISGMQDTMETPAICFYNSSKTFISGVAYDGSIEKAITIPTNAVYFRTSYRTNNTYFMIEYGTKYTGYEPHLGIEYCKIGNYEDKFIRTSGKNLFDVNEYQNLSTTYEYNLNNYHIKKIQLEPNTDYTISHNASSSSSVVILMNNVQQVNSSGYYDLRNASGSKTFTTDSTGCLYIGVLYTASDTDYNDRINSCELVINKGTTALPYEPYGSNEWYIKKNIGKVVLDGSETIATESTVAGKTRFRIGGISNVYKNSSSSDASTIKCDKLISGSVVDTYNDIQCISFGLSSGDYYKDFVVYITDTGTMSTADFITWLGTNNLTVYYRLATPTYTQITGTLETQLENVYQKLLSYTGTTNISQVNNDLSFVLDVEAVESVGE